MWSSLSADMSDEDSVLSLTVHLQTNQGEPQRHGKAIRANREGESVGSVKVKK